MRRNSMVNVIVYALLAYFLKESTAFTLLVSFHTVPVLGLLSFGLAVGLRTLSFLARRSHLGVLIPVLSTAE